MRVFLLCLLLIFCAAPRAHAFSRVYQPVGDYVRAAPLVIIADIATEGANRVLTIREVLKQDEAAPLKVGQTIALPLGITMYIVPSAAKNAAVVMAPAWKTDKSGNGLLVNEVYQTSDQIAAVRALIEIYRLPDERARLVALQNQIGRNNKWLDEQWLADVRCMEQRENFGLALESYNALDSDNRAKLLSWLGDVGDARALPLLLRALDDADKSVRATAARTLQFRFPDAPGVTAAFERLLPDAERRPLVLRYLSMRAPDLVAPYAAEIQSTAWQLARGALENGEAESARTQYFALAASSDGLWVTLGAAEALLPLIETRADKDKLRSLVIARVTRETPDYLQAAQAVALLRGLPDAANISVLIKLLIPDSRNTWNWDEVASAATFALLELGDEARQQGAARAVDAAKTRLARGQSIDSREATFYVSALAWLADDATWRDLPAQLSPAAADAFAALQPLRKAATSAHEARDLAQLVAGFLGSWEGNSRAWIIHRLGDLRDPVAVAPLFEHLTRYPNQGYSGEIERALLAIGGESVEQGALALLRSNEPALRASALEMLHQLRGPAVRPILLETLRNGDESDRIEAVTLLGYVGLPADVPLILPFADFWQTEGNLQTRAAGALANIRDRHRLGWSNAIN